MRFREPLIPQTGYIYALAISPENRCFQSAIKTSGELGIVPLSWHTSLKEMSQRDAFANICRMKRASSDQGRSKVAQCSIGLEGAAMLQG